MNIHLSIKDFYDTEAEKFHQTRNNRFREEFEYILPYIKANHKKNIKILELGCGSGRFLSYLQENLKRTFDYTGVDISENLLGIAMQEHPNVKWIASDMIDFLPKIKQESFDFIICIASFHHIYGMKPRTFVMKHINRILKYEGLCIMTNWAFSQWFIKKYWSSIKESFWKMFYTFGQHTFRDFFIPRKSGKQIYKRYYHLFTLKELTYLAKQSGMVVDQLCYIDKNGKQTQGVSNARNSLLVAKKDVFM